MRLAAAAMAAVLLAAAPLAAAHGPSAPVYSARQLSHGSGPAVHSLGHGSGPATHGITAALPCDETVPGVFYFDGWTVSSTCTPLPGGGCPPSDYQLPDSQEYWRVHEGPPANGFVLSPGECVDP